MRACFVNGDYAALKGWLDQAPWPEKLNGFTAMVLYDKKHPRKRVDILPPALKKEIQGAGMQWLVSESTGHNVLDLDTETQRLPGLFWFGFVPGSARTKTAFHGGNGMDFGLVSAGEGKIVGREHGRPNWVTRYYAFSLSAATPEQRAAAAEQGQAKWLLSGPFGDQRKAGEQFDVEFEPEKEKDKLPDLAKTCAGGVKYDKDGKAEAPKPVKWTPLQLGVGKLTDDAPAQPFMASCRLGFDHYGYEYLFTRVQSPKALDVTVGLAHRGPVKVWVNGQPVYANPRRGGFKPDDRMFPAKLKPGWNSILVKAGNVEFWETFFFALYDETEQCIPGLKFDPLAK
jgi:hypothetical protein